jgi:hypothetical protein
MSEDAKSAKADAKAAKAKAKAMRPWFKKKRFWALGLIAVVVIYSAVGGSSSSSTLTDSAGSSDSNETSDTISQGLGSNDASGDIVSIDCGTPDALGFRYPKVTIKNNSSKPSTYFITIVAESADGATRYDSTMLSIDALNPDQTMTQDGLPFTKDIPEGAICKVSEIQRTAS